MDSKKFRNFVEEMPELAEVEAPRKSVELHCAGHVITDVILRERGSGPRDGLFDDKVFDLQDFDSITEEKLLAEERAERGQVEWLRTCNG